MPELALADAGERDDLGAFVARAVRLEQDCLVRLRKRSDDAIEVWVETPFDVLVTRIVTAEVAPSDVTVSGNELLAALTVARGDRLDPGPERDLFWRSPLPPAQGWRLVDELPVQVVSELADQGIAVARENTGPKGTPPASLLDQSVVTVEGGGDQVKIPLRCLFALSGMGFLGSGEPATGESVRVSATDSWLRIDARFGAVVRRRHSLLPLVM
jgi:hypothetical protein